MDSDMASSWSCFMVTGTVSKNHLLEVGLTQNRETMAFKTLTTVDFILFYHVRGPASIEIRWNSVWLRARSHMTFTLHLRVCDHTLRFWRCVGTTFAHFLLGCHNFMVTVLGSCVKWPLAPLPQTFYVLHMFNPIFNIRYGPVNIYTNTTSRVKKQSTIKTIQQLQ